MISRETNSKIEARHLKGNAYLYVRQSTLRQVVENQESTKRQYELRQRAIALGWPIERIIVIDSDLGQSINDSAAIAHECLILHCHPPSQIGGIRKALGVSEAAYRA